jgi:DNA-binding phage protein
MPRLAGTITGAESESSEVEMVLTREFRETVANRVQKDARFRRALLIEAVDALLESDLATGKALLRDYINATMGFEALAEALDKDSKSLHRMLGPKGNPRADNLFAIIKVLQDIDEVRLQVKAVTSKAA